MRTPDKLTSPWVPWKTSDVLIGVSLVILGAVFLIAILVLILDSGNIESGPILLGTIVATSSLMLVTSLVLGPLRHRVTVGQLGLRLPATKGLASLTLPALTLAGMIGFNFIYSFVTAKLGWDVLMASELPFKLDFDYVGLTLAGLVVIAIGPFAEEVFFRGFAFPGLAKRLGPLGAILASSVIFSLLHINIALLIPSFMSGLLLACLYQRTRSLLGCVIAHGTLNALAFAAAVSA